MPGRDLRKVALLHENGTWEEKLFRVPFGSGGAFERVRDEYQGTVEFRKIVAFVDFGTPDTYDVEAMDVRELEN